ncbi:MAG: hypothetical protein AAFR36_32860 [Bacteroidota bacterium]
MNRKSFIKRLAAAPAAIIAVCNSNCATANIEPSTYDWIPDDWLKANPRALRIYCNGKPIGMMSEVTLESTVSPVLDRALSIHTSNEQIQVELLIDELYTIDE